MLNVLFSLIKNLIYFYFILYSYYLCYSLFYILSMLYTFTCSITILFQHASPVSLYQKDKLRLKELTFTTISVDKFTKKQKN